MEKQESNKALSNFPTATTATNYNRLWGTDSEGNVTYLLMKPGIICKTCRTRYWTFTYGKPRKCECA